MSSQKTEGMHRNKLFNLEGHVALVTGGGSGIGLMITQALVANGAKVYITGRTQEKLDRAAEIHSGGGQIIPLQGDVTSKKDIEAHYKEISSKEKCLSVLVNNAGVSSTTFQVEASSADEMKKNLFDDEKATFEDWTSSYQSLVPQVFFMTTAFLPLLAKATEVHPEFSATVINIASISGMVKTSQHHFAYNSAKAATIHLSRMMANDIAQNGIKVRINTISPGVFPSEMTAGESDDKQKSFIEREKYEDKVPAKRPGRDEDMAGAALFFVQNQYLNGQNVAVDGGYTLAAGL